MVAEVLVAWGFCWFAGDVIRGIGGAVARDTEMGSCFSRESSEGIERRGLSRLRCSDVVQLQARKKSDGDRKSSCREKDAKESDELGKNRSVNLLEGS